MCPCAGFEEDGDEAEFEDGFLGGDAFGGELLEGGADEDADALIGGFDGGHGGGKSIENTRG